MQDPKKRVFRCPAAAGFSFLQVPMYLVPYVMQFRNNQRRHMNITCKQERRKAGLCCAVPVLYRRMRLSKPIQVRREEITIRINPSDDSPLLDKLFPCCKIRHVCTMPLSSDIVFLLNIPPGLAGHDCSSQIILERTSHIVPSIRLLLSQI